MSTPENESQSSTERKLRLCIEKLTGGRVISMNRQVRWRPAWFVEVACGEKTLPIYVRGDRQSDILPFPELRREADILKVLEAHGIPVPHVYGMCDDPIAIIMQGVPGTRDVSKAADRAERKSVAQQYIEAVAAMHLLNVEPFVAVGIEQPKDAAGTALAGLEAYRPLYEKNKSSPQPLIEFAMRWLRQHIPPSRGRPSLIQFDSGQYLFDRGRLTALYDFEFAMIGDPLTDLATMRMRDSVEPLGEEFRELCRQYAVATGEPIDVNAIKYQSALFAAVSCMQLAHKITAPKPQDPYDVYLEWDLALKRVLVLSLAESMNIRLVEPAVTDPASEGGNSALLSMLQSTVEQLQVTDDYQSARRTSALHLIEGLQRLHQCGASLERSAQAEAAEFLGEDIARLPDYEAQLEDFVRKAGPEHDESLLRYFSRQVERKVAALGSTRIGRAALHVYLPPIE